MAVDSKKLADTINELLRVSGTEGKAEIRPSSAYPNDMVLELRASDLNDPYGIAASLKSTVVPGSPVHFKNAEGVDCLRYPFTATETITKAMSDKLVEVQKTQGELKQDKDDDRDDEPDPAAALFAAEEQLRVDQDTAKKTMAQAEKTGAALKAVNADLKAAREKPASPAQALEVQKLVDALPALKDALKKANVEIPEINARIKKATDAVESARANVRAAAEAVAVEKKRAAEAAAMPPAVAAAHRLANEAESNSERLHNASLKSEARAEDAFGTGAHDALKDRAVSDKAAAKAADDAFLTALRGVAEAEANAAGKPDTVEARFITLQNEVRARTLAKLDAESEPVRQANLAARIALMDAEAAANAAAKAAAKAAAAPKAPVDKKTAKAAADPKPPVDKKTAKDPEPAEDDEVYIGLSFGTAAPSLDEKLSAEEDNEPPTAAEEALEKEHAAQTVLLKQEFDKAGKDVEAARQIQDTASDAFLEAQKAAATATKEAAQAGLPLDQKSVRDQAKMQADVALAEAEVLQLEKRLIVQKLLKNEHEAGGKLMLHELDEAHTRYKAKHSPYVAPDADSMRTRLASQLKTDDKDILEAQQDLGNSKATRDTRLAEQTLAAAKAAGVTDDAIAALQLAAKKTAIEGVQQRLTVATERGALANTAQKTADRVHTAGNPVREKARDASLAAAKALQAVTKAKAMADKADDKDAERLATEVVTQAKLAKTTTHTAEIANKTAYTDTEAAKKALDAQKEAMDLALTAASAANEAAQNALTTYGSGDATLNDLATKAAAAFKEAERLAKEATLKAKEYVENVSAAKEKYDDAQDKAQDAVTAYDDAEAELSRLQADKLDDDDEEAPKHDPADDDDEDEVPPKAPVKPKGETAEEKAEREAADTSFVEKARRKAKELRKKLNFFKTTPTSDDDDEVPAITATGATSTASTLTPEDSKVLAENKDNRTLKQIYKDFEDAIKAHEAKYTVDLKYDLSPLKKDSDSFTVTRDGAHLATVKKQGKSISYEFPQGSLDFHMADVVLRASKDTVLILHSSKPEDIEAILKAAAAEPHDAKKIKLDRSTQELVDSLSPAELAAKYPSIEARLKTDEAEKAVVDTAKTFEAAAKVAAAAEVEKAAAIAADKAADQAVKEAAAKVKEAAAKVAAAVTDPALKPAADTATTDAKTAETTAKAAKLEAAKKVVEKTKVAEDTKAALAAAQKAKEDAEAAKTTKSPAHRAKI